MNIVLIVTSRNSLKRYSCKNAKYCPTQPSPACSTHPSQPSQLAHGPRPAQLHPCHASFATIADAPVPPGSFPLPPSTRSLAAPQRLHCSAPAPRQKSTTARPPTSAATVCAPFPPAALTACCQTLAPCRVSPLRNHTPSPSLNVRACAEP